MLVCYASGELEGVGRGDARWLRSATRPRRRGIAPQHGTTWATSRSSSPARRRALAVSRRHRRVKTRFGPRHPQLGVLHATLAGVEMRAGNLDAAIAELKSPAVCAAAIAPGTGTRRVLAQNRGGVELARGHWATGAPRCFRCRPARATTRAWSARCAATSASPSSSSACWFRRARASRTCSRCDTAERDPGAVAEVIAHLGSSISPSGAGTTPPRASRPRCAATRRRPPTCRRFASAGGPRSTRDRAQRPAEAIAPLQRALGLREAGGFTDRIAEVRELLASARLAAG